MLNGLDESELAKGFVRPVRTSYVHLRCGTATKMNGRLAENCARTPVFSGALYCVDCDEHFPVGANGEFTWEGTHEKVGT